MLELKHKKPFWELKTCCLMMTNHIQHSSQVVGYHNQLHLIHQTIDSSAKLTSLDVDTSFSISEIKNRRGPKTVPT